MKVMTIGAGFVSEHLPYQNIKERITSPNDVELILNNYKPDVIINCIGKTGRPNIDWCEKNKGETAFANTAIPIMLADACEKHSVHMIQIGSGCIYFGESPNFHYLQGDKSVWPDYQYGTFILPAIKVDDGWREENFANPKSFYSKSKYACDLMLGDMKHVTTLRIRMPISAQNNHRNLINKLLGYKSIIDIPNSMTFMHDLIRCVDWAITGAHTGIFHVTNPEPITAARIMNEYKKYVPSHSFEIINENQLDKLTAAKRSNCILDSSKLRNAGFNMTPSEDALKICMAEYVKNI
jgi:dTDP-4-dehydrorhamnose reductase